MVKKAAKTCRSLRRADTAEACVLPPRVAIANFTPRIFENYRVENVFLENYCVEKRFCWENYRVGNVSF
jgi:hypothetical protein